MTTVSGKRVLVVEDEQTLRDALKAELEREGIVVSVAANGEEGLASALKERPDLVVLDIIMPKMDGITMLKLLRASGEWGKRASVICLTKLEADDAIMKWVVENEPSYYLMKPTAPLQEVVEKVKTCLRP